MATEITIPRLGWSMEEGTFAAWLKQPGEKVEAGELLFAVESDKVTMDVESLDSGYLHVLAGAPQSGETVKPGQRIGYLLAEGEPAPAEEEVAAAAAPVVAQVSASVVVAPVREGRNAATPRARRAARDSGVDIRTVKGTGRGGRIRERDVLAVRGAGSHVPVTTLRRTIAERMMQSRQNTAPVTLTTRADASNLVKLRNQHKASHTDVIAKLVAAALREHPMLGGRWEGERITLPAAIHIGFAVDTEHGLYAPVIRNVDSLDIGQIAERSRELIAAARERRLKAEDLQGGTFTITNLGAFGIDAFTPILNYPETAVLGLGAIRKEPVVLADGQIAARDQITLSLTFDHRVVDGGPAARFLQRLVALIEAA